MAQRRGRTPRLGVGGTLWVTADGENLGSHARMALLQAVVEQGSITQAAKAFGMSYKAAWDAVDAMNRLAGEALVERRPGGRGGGSTQLTEHGRRVLERYAQVEQAHQRFVELLAREAFDLTQEFSLLKVLNVRTTARNQFLGTVSALRSGAVHDEVELTLPGGMRLAAIVTRESTEALGLRVRAPAIAMVQAGHVILATGVPTLRVSARNQIPGTVLQLQPGAVNTEVLLEVDGGGRLVAMVTPAAVQDLGLAPGVRATALVKASDVVLAVTI
ncbi:TOBE domain-containing protein [Rubrivivax gelatinosus]|uniref:Putative ModE family transcriptional regulator n=1 Tax=Rubrivivax gelatinosus (strain NBRC 100245 / IL144) TaxID=983917 RepID=I0HQZ0_RUBGI|nr:TOBE domain-containing protein [Rubrivivax gelatinosus]BAL95427.1 putative ModE family transcriptional regulator [Rubrivivax gelatinosus IL144]